MINVRCLKIELDLYIINVNMISEYYVILEIQCCQIKCLHVFSSVLWCSRKNDVRFVSTPICFVVDPCFISVICGVQQDFHFSLCSCHLTVTGQVSLVDQELPTFPEHPSSLPVFSGVHVAWSLVFCVMFCRSLFVLWFFFFLAIVLSVLRFMASDYPFGIFKFFSYHQPWQPSWIIDGIYGHNFETNHPRRIWTKIGFIPSSGSGEDFQRKSHGSHFGCRKRSPGTILEEDHSKSIISKFGPIWPNWFLRRSKFEKQTDDRHRMPIDGKRVHYTFMALVGRYEGLFTRRSNISPREIWLLRVNKPSYPPTTRAINCLLYRNYTHNNKTF